MAKDSLNLCRREGKGKTRFAQTVSLPFSSLQQKFKAPSRAGVKHTVDCQCSTPSCVPNYALPTASLAFRTTHQPSPDARLRSPSVWPLTFLPLMAPWIFVSGREEDGELSERSEFSPSPPGYKNPRGSRHLGRAILLLTFFGKTKKSESCPAGYETGMDHKQEKPSPSSQLQLRLPLRQPPHERLALRDLRQFDVLVGLVRLFDIAGAAHHRWDAGA